MEKKTLTIYIEMKDILDHYHEEDIAKQCWPYLMPFLTRRHGIDKGELKLQDGAVTILWEYEDYHENYNF